MGRRRIALVVATAAAALVAAPSAAPAASGCAANAHAAKRDASCVPDVVTGMVAGSSDNFSWTGQVNLRNTGSTGSTEFEGAIEVHWRLLRMTIGEPYDVCHPLQTEGSVTAPAILSYEADPLHDNTYRYNVHSDQPSIRIDWDCESHQPASLGDSFIIPISDVDHETSTVARFEGTATWDVLHQQWTWSLIGTSSRPPERMSANGVDFIEREEAFRARAYNDSAGYCTIGYGTLLLPKHSCNARDRQREVTEKEAEAQLESGLHRYEADVRGLQSALGTNLSQCQFDALASFRYNVSAASWRSLSRAAKAKGLAAVPAELQKYVKAKDIETGLYTTKAELVSRRKSEAALFAKAQCPCDGLPPAAHRPYYS